MGLGTFLAGLYCAGRHCGSHCSIGPYDSTVDRRLRGVPLSLLLGMALCGALWGVSLVFFGRAVDTVGVAITFAVSLGTSAASGALIPLVSQHSANFHCVVAC